MSSSSSGIRSLPGPGLFPGRSAATLAFFVNPIGHLGRLFEKYGSIVGVRTTSIASPPAPGYPGSVFLYGPDNIREVVTRHNSFHRVALSNRLYPVGEPTPRQEPLKRVMTGLTGLNGDEYHQRRRLLMPSFCPHAVRSYFQNTLDTTLAFFEDWNPGETRDIAREMLHLCMRIFAVTLFGNEGAAGGEKITHQIEEWFRFVMSPAHLFPIDLPGFPYRRWLDLSKEIDTTTRQMISGRRDSGAEDRSLLSDLIRARDEDDGSGFSEDELIGHVSLLLWGSRDATAYSLAWTLFLLSQHPEIAAQLADELRPLQGNPPEIDQLSELVLLDRVIRESLRLFPPFPMTHRVAAEDTEVSGFTIPKRAEVLLSIYHTHRIPKIFFRARSIRPGPLGND